MDSALDFLLVSMVTGHGNFKKSIASYYIHYECPPHTTRPV